MPVLARVYHVPPSEQGKLTLTQFYALQRDYHELQEAEEG